LIALKRTEKWMWRGEKGCGFGGEVSGDDRKVFKAIKQMKKRKNGATCLSADCYFSELVLYTSN